MPFLGGACAACNLEVEMNFWTQIASFAPVIAIGLGIAGAGMSAYKRDHDEPTTIAPRLALAGALGAVWFALGSFATDGGEALVTLPGGFLLSPVAVLVTTLCAIFTLSYSKRSLVPVRA